MIDSFVIEKKFFKGVVNIIGPPVPVRAHLELLQAFHCLSSSFEPIDKGLLELDYN